MSIFDEAVALDKAGQYDKAEELYDMILSQNHDNPGILGSLGVIYLRKAKYGMAISLFHRALEDDPKHSGILSNLGLAYKNSGQTEKSMKYLELASIGNDPTAEVISNYAGMFTQTGRPEKAQELCEKAISMDPGLPIAHWNLALALLESGQWDRAWDEAEWGLKRVNNAVAMRTDREFGEIPYWDGTEGKTIAVYGEQGLGDEIMFSSMLPDVMKKNTVILECHKRLKTLFEKSFGLTCYGTREDTQISWPFSHEIDYRVSIGSLGKFYRRTKESFPGTPYLKAEPLEESRRFRVGISWSGGQKASRVKTRSVPLSWWRPILNNDCEFVSLQYTDCEEEIKTMEKQGYSIKQYPEVKAEDYYETAKLVASCDLVISVCTSVIHLAGALGIPCWVMTPNKPAWRYGVKGPMPWYQCVRLYRQTDSWLPVVDKVSQDLRELLEEADGSALIRAA